MLTLCFHINNNGSVNICLQGQVFINFLQTFNIHEFYYTKPVKRISLLYSSASDTVDTFQYNSIFVFFFTCAKS